MHSVLLSNGAFLSSMPTHGRSIATCLSARLHLQRKNNSVPSITLWVLTVCMNRTTPVRSNIPQVPQAIRREVQQFYAAEGLAGLQQAVQQADPDYWAVVDQANPQRLMHCLEICRTTGGAYSALRKQSSMQQQRPFVVERQVITRPREELYERINARVINMVEQGLVEEADRAFRLTIGDDYRSMSAAEAFTRLPNSLRTVGYQELLPYMTGETSLEQAVAQIQTNTRHYAKRQMTWWRNR